MAKTKKRKARKKRNPSRLFITNRSKGGKGTRSRGFFGRIFNRLAEDGKNAGGVYLGFEAGKVAEELGYRYLSGTAGTYTTPAALLLGWFALAKFVKGSFGRYVRLGLLSRLIDFAAAKTGVSPSAQVIAMLPGGGVPTTFSTEPSVSGLGMLSSDRLNTKIAGVGSPYLRAYMQPY